MDSAIEDIVNGISSDSNDQPVQINLDHLNASDGIKKKVRENFKFILDLLDFDKKHMKSIGIGMQMVDFYHKIIDIKNLKKVYKSCVILTQ